MLCPENTQSRTVISLNGIWNFALLSEKSGYDPAGPLKESNPMPVPSAYNDIYEGRELRDHAGDVVYERSFFVQGRLLEGRLLLRFCSVTHYMRRCF